MKNFRSTFKSLAHDKGTDSAVILQYAIMRAMSAKTNQDPIEIAGLIIQKSFSPITDINKLNNNQWHRWKAIEIAVNKTQNDIAAGRMTGLLSDIETPFEAAQFNMILDKINEEANLDDFPVEKKYTYIFVRTDLSQEQVCVQSAHATLQLGFELAKTGMNIDVENLNFVVCSATDEDDLVKIEEFFNLFNVHTVPFIEENFTMTAFATYPISERFKNKNFQHFQLLSYHEPRTVAYLDNQEE
jgi:hypothetical protein